MVTERKRPDTVTVAAVYHFVEAVLFLAGLSALGLGAIMVLVRAGGEPGAGVVLAAIGFGALAMVVLLIADVLVGWGLLNLKDWARWVAIVLSVFRLPWFPIGTVIGVVIIVLLLQRRAKDAFEGE